MNDIDEVRARLDIVEVVGSYVQLKRAGRSYKGLCPFHDEKTPSFIVFPDSGNWRCFGACAVGGDAFDFVMRRENLDFRATLELLAQRVGVVLEAPTPAAAERKDRRERLFEATAAAAELFQSQLMRSADGEPARAYLRERGFGIDAAQAFGLGWAPDAWSTLAEKLTGKGFTEAELLAAGLVKARDSGGVYDTFRGRLVFPIHDARGRPIGFGARTLDPQGIPKYLNSPQSEIFDKSQVLFGLHRAARAIRAEDLAVVVEGYTDVLRAHMAGFENVVASLGTAITEHQLRALKRYTHTMVLALDADAAGQAATLRGLEVAREAAAGGVVPVPTGRGRVHYSQRTDVELRVVSMPAGKDPDDVIREGPANWRKLVTHARPVMDYLFGALTEGLDLSSPGGKTTAAERLLPPIAEIGDPVARSAWLARLAQMIQIDEQALGERLSVLVREQQRRPRPRLGDAEPGATPGFGLTPDAERGSGSASGPRIPSRRAAKDRPPAAGLRRRPAGAGDAGAEPGPPGQPAGDAGEPAAARATGDGLPDWVTAEVPLDARASELPPDATELELDLDRPEPKRSRPDGEDVGAASLASAAPGPRRDRGARPAAEAEPAPDREPVSYLAGPRASSDSLVAWILGQLLVDPERLAALSQRLQRDQQAPLGPQDFGDSHQRDLMTAIAYAAGGGAPPDAPAEHRLEALPEPLASYAAELRERGLSGLPMEESARIESLRACCLRLRKRELDRALPGLRYLMLEADAEAQLDYMAKVNELTQRLNALTQLIVPLGERQVGKIDGAVKRDA
ncbi:MAG: DNA primase [Caldilineae bacterium]|nr:DNA primase [Chloroflexota bacterium]MCB9176894.1 DNA primase [Caldilineae bacterium]